MSSKVESYLGFYYTFKLNLTDEEVVVISVIGIVFKRCPSGLPFGDVRT